MSISDEMYKNFFFEAGDPDIPDLIEPVVKILERKGYGVKYSSPGHTNTRFENDRNKDTVINGKYTTTARIIFDHDYKFPNTPQGWEWKVLKNNSKALYVKPYSQSQKHGNPENAFKKWQQFYMSTIRTWAENLPEVGESEKGAPDTNFNK